MKGAEYLIVVSVFTLSACGPGRQAAWEKQPASEQKTPHPPVTAAPAVDAKAAALVEQAKAAWEKREERASLEQAISSWEKAIVESPNDAESLMRLARAYYLLADGFMRLANEQAAALATFEKGVNAGERAMMAVSEPFAGCVKAGGKVEDCVDKVPKEGQSALYWYATNLGKFAVAKGFTTTLFYKDRIVSVMRQVLQLDETYLHGAPHRYFGAFFAKAPAFAGGDMTKSKEHFDRALQIQPNYFGTKTVYAEYYATKTEDKELFERLLTEVQAGDPAVLPDLIPEQSIEQQKAAHLMSQLNELF